MRLVWDEASYGTGEYTIDSQHRELFRRINWVVEAQEDPSKSVADVLELMDFLEQYVIEHFEYEEREMAFCAHPLSAQNRAEHQAFKSNLSELKTQLEAFGPSPDFTSDLEKLLIHWISAHIQAIDAKFQWKKWTIVEADAM